jgi:hypothetical protein
VCLIALPVVGILVERDGSSIAERHHQHHDTYLVPQSFTRFLVTWTLIVSAVGIGAAALAWGGVIPGHVSLMLGVFLALDLVLAVEWVLSRHYRIATFTDHLTVRTFLGHEVTLDYASIERMSWLPARLSGFPDLSVTYGGGKRIKLSGMVDLDQVVERIGRSDVLERDPS